MSEDDLNIEDENLDEESTAMGEDVALPEDYIDIQTPERSHEVRYYIRRHGYKQPTGTEITTGFLPAPTEDEQVVKFIKNNHVYILRRGQVYTVIGQRVQ